MCHETTARPPLPPIGGGAGVARSEPLVLEAADGNRLRAFTATAIDPEAAGIVILPDVRGLHPFYERLAVRFAEVGIHATAIDYFGRTAGTGERDEEFDFKAHVPRVTTEGLRADVAAALAHTRSDAGGPAARVFTVGFCLGGRHSFNQAADQELDGVIGFYGGPQGRGPDDDLAPVRLAPGYRCPVLGIFGGADEGIPLQEIERFRRTLAEAGVPNEMVVYEGAPHSFFDRTFEEHREACDDAWRRILTFVRPKPS
ncbi:MAG: dienelactone hydrolase family protein [Actinomycetota bacterium]